jgi:pyridoxal phosphate enzyme (YggS family)
VTSGHDDERRRAELVTALGALRARIADACSAVGRDPRGVTLVAITKTFPASDVAILASIGVSDVGENRDQEAVAKVAATAELLGGAPVPRWHFIGQLQTNKARAVSRYASAVHSVDRAELAARLNAGALAAGRSGLEIFVQVSMDGDPHRGGVVAGEVPEVADAVAAQPALRLRGVMTVLPLDMDPDEGFARLAEISHALRERYPEATAISAGMTHDFEQAVRHGATHVRIGTALLGRREQVFG